MQHLRVRVIDPNKFEPDSLRTVWISKENGIQAIMGKNDKGNRIPQSYMFDKSKWESKAAVSYLEKRGTSRAERLGLRRTSFTSAPVLYTNQPDWKNKDVQLHILTAASYKPAQLADKYFFYTEFVHEGTNLNGDHFTAEELEANFESASFNPIDWEHNRDEVVGFSMEAQLVKSTDEEIPLAVGFNGVLNRTSPHLMVDGRDEIVRQRFFEGQLFTSMEVVFDEFGCLDCDFHTSDFIEFDFHVMAQHPQRFQEDPMAPRKLIGIDFVGAGIVEFPADTEAGIFSLRTADDGLIKVSIASDQREKYGEFAHNILSSLKVASLESDIDLSTGEIIVAGEEGEAENESEAPEHTPEEKEKNKKKKKKDKDKKDKDKKPKKRKKSDNDNERNVILSNEQGGEVMFKLTEKTSKAKSLSDVFVIAQQVLKDFIGDNSLTSEQSEAFASELSEVISELLTEAEFKVSSIYTLTDEAKLDAISNARDEEKKTAQLKFDEITATMTQKDTEIEGLNTKVSTLTKDNKDLKDAEVKKEQEAKVDAFVESLKSSGITMTESMEGRVKTLAVAIVDDSDELKSLRSDLLATAKQSTLANGSEVLGGNGAGGETGNPSSLKEKLEAVREAHVKEGNK